jgi:hypothetical protein
LRLPRLELAPPKTSPSSQATNSMVPRNKSKSARGSSPSTPSPSRWHQVGRAILGQAWGVVIGTGLASGGIGYYFTHLDREANIRLSDYQALAASQEEFNTLLNDITYQVSTKGTVNPDKVQLISSNLVHQYSKIDAFSVVLPASSRAVLFDYKSAISAVKQEMQSLKGEQDLATLGESLAKMYRSEKALQPLLDDAAGRPTS